MSMIVSVAAMRDRFDIQDLADVNCNLKESLVAATIQLEDILRTLFSIAVYKDQYWVDPQEQPYTADFIKLKLNTGFVDSSIAIVIKTATQLQDLTAATAIDNGFVKFDYEKGLIFITGSNVLNPPLNPFFLSGKFFMQADYTAGFDTQATEFGEVFIGIPTWLNELGLNMAYRLYKLNTGCEGAELTCSTAIVQSLLDRHTRFFPSAIQPLI